MKVLVDYWNEYVNEGMRLDFADLIVRCLKNGSSNIHGFSDIADQRVCVTVEVKEVNTFALSWGGSVHNKPREIVKPDVSVEDDYENRDIKGFMTAEEVEASGL